MQIRAFLQTLCLLHKVLVVFLLFTLQQWPEKISLDGARGSNQCLGPLVRCGCLDRPRGAAGGCSEAGPDGLFDHRLNSTKNNPKQDYSQVNSQHLLTGKKIRIPTTKGQLMAQSMVQRTCQKTKEQGPICKSNVTNIILVKLLNDFIFTEAGT